MGYSISEISDILLKADKTLYRLGSVAYDNMFAEDSEDLDYERDLVFIYKKSVEWADDFYVGTLTLDKVVERLDVKVHLYDYGKLAPVYSDVVNRTISNSVSPYVLKVTPLVLGNGLFGSTDFTGSNVSISIDYDFVQATVRENYIHNQQVAASVWTVVHNMNKYPAINIVDTSNDIIMGEVRYNSLNQLTITFTASISGKAYLN